MNSPKTSISGIIAAIGLLLTLVATLFDADPTNNADFGSILNVIGTVLAALGIGKGFINAKDDSK
jgi:hypothetical protein